MTQDLPTDQLDEVVDAFEAGWSGDDGEPIETLLQRFGLQEDLEAIAELVRIDIEFRYERSLEVDLDQYFTRFPQLGQSPVHANQVAFEDYRTRAATALDLAPSRWEKVPGIDEQAWFHSLKHPSVASPRAVAKSCAEAARGVGGLLEDQDFRSAVTQAGFQLVRILGSGAFSQVCLATQGDLADRFVVLKVVDRPLQEPQQMARLQHTNIVPIYSFHRLGRRSALCMPYAGLVTLANFMTSGRPVSARSGESLVTTVRQRVDDTLGKLSQDDASSTNDGWTAPAADDAAAMQPLERLQSMSCHELALWLFNKLAAALAHSHARGVLHGDLKPANILVRNDGEPALIDFNLSRRLGRQDGGWIGGTLPYMSPENLRALMGQEIQIGEPSDIYSLGVILFEFVLGRLPFPAPHSAASTDLEKAIRQRSEMSPWLPSDRLPPGLRAILDRCLTADEAKRYPSAEHLQRDLECEIQHRPLAHAREPSVVNRIRKWARRHPRLSSAGMLSAVAAIGIALIGGLAWQLGNRNRALAAQTTREVFRQTSATALANLMVVGRDEESGARLEAADRCLQLYGVLENSDWQSATRLTYLDDDSRRFIHSRLTELLLRSTFHRLARIRIHGTAPSASSVDDIQARLALLGSDPFPQFAPVSIHRLRHEVDELLHDGPASWTLPPLSSEHPIDLFSESLHLLDHKHAESALELLVPELLNVIDPFSYWIALGRAQMETDQLPAALTSFSMAIQQQKSSPFGYYYRGVCRMRIRTESDTDEAIQDFSHALRRSPGMVEARVNRALAAQVLGDWKAALKDLNTALQSATHSNRILVIRSRVQRRLGNQTAAEEDMRQALKTPPETVEDWISRAFARLPTDKEGALADLRAAEALAPTSAMVLQNQAHVLSEYLLETDQAIERLTRLLQIDGPTQKALLGRAVLWARRGDAEEARADLKRAHEAFANLTAASLYQEACVHALLAGHAKRHDQEFQSTQQTALQFLSRAILAGYGREHLTTDPDLLALREEPAFQTIVETIRLGQPP